MPVIDIGKTAQTAPRGRPTNEGHADSANFGPRTPTALGMTARIALGLFGGLTNFMEGPSVRRLADAVDARDADGLKGYLSRRSLAFLLLHPSIQEHAFGIFKREYNDGIKKLHARIARSVSRIKGQGSMRIERVGKDPGRGTLLTLVPPFFESINHALDFAEKSASGGSTPGGKRAVQTVDGGVLVRQDFKIRADDPTIGPVIKRALSEIVPILIRARALEDLFAARGVYLSAEAFKKLIIPHQQVGDLLFSDDVRGILDLNNHLRQHFSGLSSLERAAIVSHYSSKKDPVGSFTNALEKLQAKIHQMQDILAAQASRPAVASELSSPSGDTASKIERKNAISKIIAESPLGTELGEREFKLLVRSIGKLCQKRGVSLENLRDLVHEAASGAELIAALSNMGRPITSSVDMQVEDRGELRAPPLATWAEVSTPPVDPYVDREMRANLRSVLRRGSLRFYELRTLLLGDFDCTFSPSLGPGSHSKFIRTMPEGSLEAQVSSRVRNDQIPLEIGIILKTLEDLKIDPNEFVRQLRLKRGLD